MILFAFTGEFLYSEEDASYVCGESNGGNSNGGYIEEDEGNQ
jgi:hypothetical protein